MRVTRILAALALLFFCSSLMQAQHIRMQDPICSGDMTKQVLGNTFTFSATAAGDSGGIDPSTGLPIVDCFFNNSLTQSNWNFITVTLDSSAHLLASDVFCDSPANPQVAFNCTVDSVDGIVTDIVFSAGPGQTGIPFGRTLMIDLNPCSDTGENCSSDSGTKPWLNPDGSPITFTALVPEPTALMLLGAGLLVSFRKRFLK